MTRKQAGIAALATGTALAITGLVLYIRRRSVGLGQIVSQNKSAGMTLTHYRDDRMPINQRVGIIQDLVWKSIQDPKMRKIALKVTKNCPARDGECEAKAIYKFVKDNVRYTGDIAMVKMGRNGPVEGVDLFQSAFRTLEFGGGDCDDHSVAIATLLALNGISPKLRVTAPKRPGSSWAHIYALAGLSKNQPTRWVAMDTTLPNGKMGSEVPYGKKRDFVA